MTSPIPANGPTPTNAVKDVHSGVKQTGSASGLTKQWHGLPIYAWVCLVLGGCVVGLYFRRSQTAAKAQSKAASATPEEGSGYTTAGYIAPTTVAASTSILTNTQWMTAAQTDLIQKGFDGTSVTAAVQNYVNNKSLTGDQQTMINQAIKDIGPLPQLATGQNNNYSLLNTPKAGNIFGQLAYSLGGILGLNDPNNKMAQYVDPFFNDIIDSGPITGVFSAANQVLGGNVGINIDPKVSIPGVGDIGANLGVSNSGVSGGLDLPTFSIPTPWGTIGVGGGGSGSIGPNNSQSYQPYIVQDGDTLQSISQQFYGGTGGASLIYSSNSNKIPDQNNLVSGTVLQIPSVSNYSS